MARFVGGGNAEGPAVPENEVQQIPVGDLHTLGLPGGTGCVDDIGEVFAPHGDPHRAGVQAGNLGGFTVESHYDGALDTAAGAPKPVGH